MELNLTDAEIQEKAALHALGALSQNEAHALEGLIADVPAVLAAVESFREVVGFMGLSVEPADPSPELRSRLLVNLERLEEARDLAENAVEEFFVIRESDEGWRPFAEGVYFKELFVNRERGTTTTLLRILPGGSVPAHRHSSIEEIFVIEGLCQINADVLGPGDYRCAQAGTSDRILTTKDGTTVLVLGPTSLELL